MLHAEVLRDRMCAEAMSYDRMAEVIGLGKTSVQRWARDMREAGLIHIAAYGPDKNGRLFVPLYKWGRERDVDRPGHKETPAERMRAKRAEAAKELRDALIGRLK